jgi:3-oxoacyl-[acyl-carrier protein] reductase
VSKAARIADYTVADFDNLFATNVRGQFFLVQQLLPISGEGLNVIVISSLAARFVAAKPDWRVLRFLLTRQPEGRWKRW